MNCSWNDFIIFHRINNCKIREVFQPNFSSILKIRMRKESLSFNPLNSDLKNLSEISAHSFDADFQGVHLLLELSQSLQPQEPFPECHFALLVWFHPKNLSELSIRRYHSSIVSPKERVLSRGVPNG